MDVSCVFKTTEKLMIVKRFTTHVCGQNRSIIYCGESVHDIKIKCTLKNSKISISKIRIDTETSAIMASQRISRSQTVRRIN